MRYRHTIAAALLLASCTVHGLASGDTLATFERLSLDLRAQRLDASERALVHRALGEGRSDSLYRGFVDAWLDVDGIERFVDTFLRFPTHMVVEPDAESFFQRLARHDGGGEPLYFLPHTTRAAAGEPPCPPRRGRRGRGLVAGRTRPRVRRQLPPRDRL